MIVLDTGALIAVDRGDRQVLSMLESAFRDGVAVRVPAGVIGQAWRSPDRQVLLARTLKRCNEVPLDGATARTAGQLCGQTGSSDVIDATVAIVASETGHQEGDVMLLTSDSPDIRILLDEVRTAVRIVDV